MRSFDYKEEREFQKQVQIEVQMASFAQKLRVQLQNDPKVYHDGRCFRTISTIKGSPFYEEKGKAYIVSGLTPNLHKIFWPDYDYNAKAPQKGSSTKRKGKGKGKGKGKKKRGKKFRLAGKEHGSYIHHQIETMTNTASHLQNMHPQDVLKNPFVDDQTKKALISFEAWGLTRVVSELPVYHSELNIATAVDLVCHDKNGDIVLVELKTNSPNTFYCGQGTNGMHSNVLSQVIYNDPSNELYDDVYSKKIFASLNEKDPMHIALQHNMQKQGFTVKRWNNSPRNQALIQLLFTKMIFEHDTGRKVQRAYVVHITDNLVSAHLLPDWLLARELHLYNEFLSKMETRIQ